MADVGVNLERYTYSVYIDFSAGGLAPRKRWRPNMTTFTQAKHRAAALAGARRLPMAVVDCGCEEFTVKNAFLAARHYAHDIKFVALPAGWKNDDRAKIASGAFGK